MKRILGFLLCFTLLLSGLLTSFAPFASTNMTEGTVETPRMNSSGDVSPAEILSYAKYPLAGLVENRSATVTLHVTEGTGTVLVYGVSDIAASNSWTAESLTYANAVAATADVEGIDTANVLDGTPIASVSVSGAGDYKINVTDYFFTMKEAGAEYATLLFAAPTTNTGVIRFNVDEEEEIKYVEKVVTDIDFEDYSSIILAKTRSANVYGTTDVYMQGDYQNSSVTLDTDPIQGKCVKIDGTNTSGANTYKFWKILPVFTSADIGKEYKLTFKMKMSKLNSVSLVLSTCGYTSYAAQNDATAIYQKVRFAAADQTLDTWMDMTYTFTVQSEMIGNPPTDITTDTRPVLFTIYDLGKGTNVWLDDFKLTTIEPEETAPSYTTEIDFEDYTEINLARTRAANVYGTTDVYMQGNYQNASVTLETDSVQGKCVKIGGTTTGGYNVYKFWKILPVFTSADLGKQYELTFKMKVSATQNIGLLLASCGSSDNNAQNATSASYQRTDIAGSTLTVGEWKDMTYTFTVQSEMIGNPPTDITTDTRPVLFTICTNYVDGTDIWVDDFKLLDVTPKGSLGDEFYRYSHNFEDQTGLGFEGLPLANRSVSNAENTTPGGSYSQYAYLNTTAGRILVGNVLNATNTFTSADIGKQYKITFKYKCNTDGAFWIQLGNSDTATSRGQNAWAVDVKYPSAVKNTWQTCTYNVTLTEDMLTPKDKDGVATATPATLLCIFLYGFGSGGYNFYLDDLVCETVPTDNGVDYPALTSKAVGNSTVGEGLSVYTGQFVNVTLNRASENSAIKVIKDYTMPAGTWLKEDGTLLAGGSNITATEGAVYTEVSIEMLNGASIRTISPSGLRFTSTVRESLISILNDNSVSYTVGTLVLPTDLIGDKVFNRTNFASTALDFTFDISSLTPEENVYKINAAITGILPQNYCRAFSAVSYIAIGDTVVYSDYSAENNSRSVYEVAKAAYADNTSGLNDSQKAIVRSFIDGVIEILSISNENVVTVYAPANSTAAHSVSYDGATLSASAGDNVKTIILDGKFYTGGWTVTDNVLTAHYVK